MAKLSKDIQCVSFDTRPPMLDRTDFASLQQRIRLYCRCKENGVNILKSIDEGPFQMGTLRETLTEGTEDTMADINIPANDAPTKQAHVVAPPTRTDDQILPAFTASSTIPAIYIQQFWDTICFNSSNGLYSCQLDEQWFNLHKDILRDALNITPTNDNNPFVAPPSSDIVIEYVNTLGYPGKTVRFDKPRHPVLQSLWGIVHSSNIDYAERIWEEFVQSIQTFLTDRNNLVTASRGKKKTNICSSQALGSPNSSSITYVGKDGREIFGMPIPDALITDEIKRAPYHGEYQENVAKYQQRLDAEHGKAVEGGAT
nr:integrase, catalytic region, zinc finger, CCHC-type, peptidase aspartic, catalytic [Tanacetum cinerariifolium]